MLDFTLDDLLEKADQLKVSDIHITVGTFPCVRKHKNLIFLENFGRLMQEDTHELITQALTERKLADLEKHGEADCSFSRQGLGRYRVNAFKQRGTYAMAIRIQPFDIPAFDTLGLPAAAREFADLPGGLVLVTGVTGSGKSTTLASLLDIINSEQSKHIITVEDPIEYLHRHKKSIVNQREIGLDSESFATALRGALREDPDVILVGEMRDLETTRIAITAAETGHLVFSTMHTLGAAKTVDRILDIFPPEQQNQIRNQLATVLQGVITQQLIPKMDDSGVCVACEVLKTNSAISNLIREGKPYQINSVLQTNTMDGMQTMNSDLLRLFRNRMISREEAILRATDKKGLQTLLNNPF